MPTSFLLLALLVFTPFTPLFNGRDLAGWTAVAGPIESWSVVDGVLTCSGQGEGWLSTEHEYDNFELSLEFRLAPGGNSGVFLRAPREKSAHISGLEIQLLDDAAPQYAQLKPYQYCGGLYFEAAPSRRVSKPAGEWQSIVIHCDKSRVQVTLNGVAIVDADLDQLKDHADTHPGVLRRSGYVGLQNHSTKVEFRSVRLRKL